jgi:hypothetical protein
MAKYFATSLAIEKVVSAPRRDEQLLADLDDLDELRRVGVEVDHVAGLAGGLGAGVHGHADVGLRQGRRVVGAVAGHGHQPALGLLAADELHLALGCGLGEEVVDAGLGRDLGGGQPVVAGDHDGPDAHRAQPLEAGGHPLLDRVLEVDDAEHLAVARHGQRRAALAGDAVDRAVELARRGAALGANPVSDRVGGALAQHRPVHVDPAHARLRGEGHEARRGLADGRHLVLAQPVLLGQHDDRAPFGGLIGQRGELCDLGEVGLGDAGHGHELRRLAVAERDGAGLVEEQDVDVARCLDGTAREGEHVAAHEPVHARDADRAEQGADGGGDEGHEQGDQRRDRDVRVGVVGEGLQRDDDDDEDERQRGEQDVQGDLVGRLAPLGALDERDHPVQEGLAGLLGDLDHDAVGEHAGAAGHRAAVAAGLADDGRRLAGDGGLVDRGDALDDGAVARDDLAGLDDDQVAAVQLARRACGAVVHLRDGLGAHRAQRVGLRAPAPSASASAKLAKTTGQPQPHRHRDGEEQVSLPPPNGSPVMIW